METFYEAVGIIGGICTAVCFLPQTLKTLKNKEVRGLSLLSYSLYCIGILSWIIYGYYKNSVSMIISNSFSLLFAAAILLMIILYRRKTTL